MENNEKGSFHIKRTNKKEIKQYRCGVIKKSHERDEFTLPTGFELNSIIIFPDQKILIEI